jgi:hypothetical protein
MPALPTPGNALETEMFSVRAETDLTSLERGRAVYGAEREDILDIRPTAPVWWRKHVRTYEHWSSSMPF